MALPLHDLPEILVRFGAIGIEAQRYFELCLRLVEPPLLGQGFGQSNAGIGKRWLRLQRRLAVGDNLLKVIARGWERRRAWQSVSVVARLQLDQSFFDGAMLDF